MKELSLLPQGYKASPLVENVIVDAKRNQEMTRTEGILV